MIFARTKKDTAAAGYTFTGKNGRVVRLGAPLPPEVTEAIARAMAEGCNRRHPPAPPEIGDKMADGSIYAGDSPDTGKPMYVTARDTPLSVEFYSAATYARGLDAHGHKDWRLPTRAELNVLFQNREKGALKGTFNLTGSYPAGWYWSGTPYDNNSMYCQMFSDGIQNTRY